MLFMLGGYLKIDWEKDAIPGYINELWIDIKEPGVYRGQCTELCGKDHGFMPIVVRSSKTRIYKMGFIESKEPCCGEIRIRKLI